MGLTDYLALGQFLLTCVVATLVWVWGRYRDLTLIVQRLDALEKRMEKAGSKTSDLASSVNGLPDRWRDDMRHEHQRLWAALDQVRAQLFGRGAAT